MAEKNAQSVTTLADQLFNGSVAQWYGFSLNIFLCFVLDFFITFFPFRLFPFILAADRF